MKTKEELNKLKEEATALANKFRELNEDELKEIVGGGDMEDWVKRMKKMVEDYYSNNKAPGKELPSNPLPGIDPSIIDEIINKD